MVNVKFDSYEQVLTCCKRTDYKNGNNIFFKITVSCDSLSSNDKEELRKTIEAVFTPLKQEDNLYDVVKNIRTIFRNYKELDLYLSRFDNEKEIISCATYKNGDLVEYEENKKVNQEFVTQAKIDSQGITLNWLNKPFDKKYFEKFKDIISAFKSLSEVEPYEITYDDQMLCIIYSQFYGNLPDFRNDNEIVKMHLLNLYLSSFGLSMSEEGERFCTFTEDYPILFSQQAKAEKIKLFGKLKKGKETDIFLDLNEETTNRLNAIKDAFYSSALINKVNINDLEVLKQIAKIAYIYAYEFAGHDKESIEYAKCLRISEEEASKALTFYRSARPKLKS